MVQTIDRTSESKRGHRRPKRGLKFESCPKIFEESAVDSVRGRVPKASLDVATIVESTCERLLGARGHGDEAAARAAAARSPVSRARGCESVRVSRIE
eukprot:2143916-Pleurochrysis_carterae.AAC.3